jgi:hypothetical protein
MKFYDPRQTEVSGMRHLKICGWVLGFLLPRIWRCWESFARAFLLGRLNILETWIKMPLPLPFPPPPFFPTRSPPTAHGSRRLLWNAHAPGAPWREARGRGPWSPGTLPHGALWGLCAAAWPHGKAKCHTGARERYCASGEAHNRRTQNTPATTPAARVGPLGDPRALRAVLPCSCGHRFSRAK